MSHPFRKKWGQNFLRDPNTITKIINCLQPCVSDTILEIGPGDGALTNQLSKQIDHIHVVEIDPLLVTQLGKNKYPNVTIHQGDILEWDLNQLKGEVKIIEEWLVDQDVNVHTLPNDDDHFIEGGEFYYCSNENILFAGESRNSRKGNEKTAELLDVEELVILRSNSFHLDTLCTPVFNSDNQLCLLIACTALLEKESVNQLKKLMHNRNIPILEIPPEEAIGTTNKLGSFAVNCLPLPGQLIGAAEFKSETVRTALTEHNITHSVVSLTQFHLSGGSVHCLTNEL